MFRVLATLLATMTIAHGIDWSGNWATSCDFIGNDLTNSLSTQQDCPDRCVSTVGCTHYTWTNYNDGTCWMKKDSVSRDNAVPKYDQGAVCGVIAGSVDRALTGVVNGVADGILSGAVGGAIVDSVGGGFTANVSGEVASAINWNGNNWAVSCQFIGNDLTNALTSAKDCGGHCATTPDCTHYTWTNYNGGTCWMKTNLVSKSDAVPKHDQGAVCGIAVKNVGGVVAGSVGGVIASVINWNGNNWAVSCQFIGNDLTNALTSAKDCGGHCATTPDCTHYTWTNYSGGTCWMKTNLVSKSNAVPKHDEGAVCGISVKSLGGAVAATVGGVIASVINWNGNNWAFSCQFIGNDLTNVLTSAKDCGGRCAATPDCTHYTWTNYNGGTCWMKTNLVSKSDAVPKHDQGAVCGIAVKNVGGVVAVSVGGVIASAINWNGNNWAVSCQFIGNDLTNALTIAKDCGRRCEATPDCTHYTWTNYNGGTCWMKTNSVTKSDAVPKHDQGAVCGISVKSAGGVVASVGGVIASAINWNGNNWAVSCKFIGNDLTNALTRPKDCDGRCASTPGCTHYTWTKYNGGTCWMKKNSVSKSNAVPHYDQDAVCGIAVKSVGGVVTASVGGVLASGINWNGNSWATSCKFIGNDLMNALTRAKECGGRCATTPGCTHYTWTKYNGGTCWMKKNSVSKSDAVPHYDQDAVCGVTFGNAGVSVVSASGNNWNGNNWNGNNWNGNNWNGNNWNGNNWVASCDLTRVEDCAWQCMSTPGCTHHTWTYYNGHRTCWMKTSSDSTTNVVNKHDHDYFSRPMPYHNQIIINLV